MVMTSFILKMKKEESGKIAIDVSDNGDGFDIDKVNRGLGLANLNYRMNMSGIKGEFNSEIGKGTNVSLKFD